MSCNLAEKKSTQGGTWQVAIILEHVSILQVQFFNIQVANDPSIITQQSCSA